MQETKVALVTGGGTGAGKAVSLGLARQGIDVVVNYSRSRAECEETAAEIRLLGAQCLVAQADVADDEQVRAMVGSAIDRFGRLDYVVNCAGTTVFVELADLEGLKSEHWDRIIDVNVKGIFNVCRAAGPYLKQAGGSIVSITSNAGLTGQGSSIAYAASKAAAICLTKSLAKVMAPEVRVNSVAPGIIMTRWVVGWEEHVLRCAEGAPLRRVCTPEDVAAVIIPLLTGMTMVTGQTIVVDGGITL